MARTIEEVLKEQIGNMCFQIAAMAVEIENLKDENTALKAPKASNVRITDKQALELAK